jgi:hypothetical protein
VTERRLSCCLTFDFDALSIWITTFEVGARRLWLAPGSPCAEPYAALEYADLLGATSVAISHSGATRARRMR